MKRHFNTHLEGLDIEFWRNLMVSRGRLVTYGKGEYLCRKGEPTNFCGYVKSGYLIYRMSAVSKQPDIGGFAFADAFCGDYPNCMYNQPAVFDLVAGRKSEVWTLDATILPQLYKEHIEYSEHGRAFMESAYNSLLRRYYSLCANTPTERYIELIREHPHVEQEVSQAEIAKYLHISPIHLCRIRKSLLIGL
ncbi:MAG: cyclic nucleotide-binding domain-containing protein [Muribaculaceae bacterium]|nr:cyclic nucleotide-binding domain-containing protein [Muribaculaceae bacterium]